MQAPLDFVLKDEEIGLDLIDGYAVRVYKLQCLVRCGRRVQFYSLHTATFPLGFVRVL